MDILKVKEIKDTYSLKAKEENYENDKTNDVVVAATEVLTYNKMLDTMANKLTFMEFTRRFERAKKELENLMGS